MATSLARQPRNGAVVHTVRLCNLPAGFASAEALPSLGLLVGIQFRLAAKRGTAPLRRRPPFVGSSQDTRPLFFCQPRQQRKNASTRRGCEIEPGTIEHLDEGTALVHTLHYADAVQ